MSAIPQLQLALDFVSLPAALAIAVKVADEVDVIEIGTPLCKAAGLDAIRAVSVSGWSDLYQMGEMLGKKYVYSRKPIPAYISGAYPDWELAEKDVRDTLTAAKGCNLELCFRDIYTIDGDRSRLARWTEMTRALMDA